MTRLRDEGLREEMKGKMRDYALRNKIKRINDFEREEFVVCHI